MRLDPVVLLARIIAIVLTCTYVVYYKALIAEDELSRSTGNAMVPSPKDFTKSAPRLDFSGANLSKGQAVPSKLSANYTEGEEHISSRDTMLSSMKAATRLLFRSESEATRYLESTNLENFRFYVYDNLEREQTWQYVETCMNAYRAPEDRCGWIEVCGETGTSSGRYGKKRYNRNGDVLLAKVFSEYQGALRTYNAEEASLFIVPFPSQGSMHCMGVNDTFTARVISRLTYFNESTKRQHLFLSSALRPAANLYMNRFPLQVTIGPALHYMCKFGRRCGNTLMPYVNSNPEYQPDQQKQFKPISGRKYGLAAFFNPSISGNGFARQEFLESSANVTQIGGKPLMVSGLGHLRSMPNERTILELYRDSIFCPCLRGDAPPQKRLFDAVLSGCLPVVLEYPAKGDKQHASHFSDRAESIRVTYPFAQDIFFQEPMMGIRYEDFVVTVDGSCGPSCILPTLDDLLTNHWDALERKHQAMRRISGLFSYGMRNNNTLYPGGDAIAAILVQARHYVNSWQQQSPQ